MFAGRKCFRVMAGLTLLSLVARPSPAQLASAALQARVAQAVVRDLHLANATPQDVQSELQILPSLSLPAEAEIEVVSVQHGAGEDTWMLRMDCRPRRDCLPFHVALHSSILCISLPRGRDDCPVHSPQHAQAASLNTGIPHKAAGPPPLVRPGDRALLVEDRFGMRFTAKALCLQGGSLGDVIHVRNLATQRILVGIVAGRALVRVE